MAGQPPIYGGQAVIEGVMIRGPRAVAVACRRPDGDIALRTETLTGRYSVLLRRVPFLRGVVVLWETLALGMRALVFSSNVQLGEEEKEIGAGAAWGAIIAALAIMAALFFAGPVLLTRWLEGALGDSIVVVLIEGLVRLAIVVAYISLIGLLPDIRRVYAYHGAEHKSINALEAGDPLEVAAVQRHSVAHVRCGTSFLLTVVVISVVVFVALGTPDLLLRILSRIVLIPVIAAIAYEVIRLGGVFHNHPLVRIIMRPNLALQALTTRQPEDDQVEIALHALKQAMAMEGQTGVAEPRP
ncbi:MAG: DUF1385 domain-containing protein [Dehalococcoidia bacterium]